MHMYNNSSFAIYLFSFVHPLVRPSGYVDLYNYNQRDTNGRCKASVR
jgi:hypothetical protein